MKYKIRNIVIPISKNPQLKQILSQKLQVSANAIKQIGILRRALDARQKNNLKFNLTLIADITDKLPVNHDVQIYDSPKPYLTSLKKLSNPNPFIIGAGPAGLFAALSLVEKGFRPYIFDRGDCLENRAKKVSNFWKNRILDSESNVQFGEGGAGAFSDGKLTSRKNNFYTSQVTNYLIKFGAPEDIAFEALPHLGTDGIRKIVLNIRKYLEEKGCLFFWNHKLENIEIHNNLLKSVVINQKKYDPEVVVLAVGNAARDTFSMLSNIIQIESKPFAVGFRIEHPQDFLNETFYGEKNDFTITGPATYRLTAKSARRGIYSFCMCPGGQVIAAASELDSVVTNGMSYYSRKGKFGNSALVVTIDHHDFGKDILAGMQFQRHIEKKSFLPSEPYAAPMQKVSDFMKMQPTKQKIPTSYLPDVYSSDLNNIYSSKITNAIKFGLSIFEKKAHGFIENGVFLAPETRTSSPVRILRNDFNLSSVTAANLFPCGEGAGYAGGIMSSAADGFKIGSIFSF